MKNEKDMPYGEIQIACMLFIFHFSFFIFHLPLLRPPSPVFYP